MRYLAKGRYQRRIVDRPYGWGTGEHESYGRSLGWRSDTTPYPQPGSASQT
jgi:hypothetical protein